MNENPGGMWMFGKFCYWIGGEQVGDFHEGTSLRDVLFSMRSIVGDTGKRTAPSLALCDDKEIFRVIQESLNESGDALTRLIPVDLMPACFDVCPHIDIFNTWHIYLVDTQDLSKVVYSADGGDNVETVGLAPGEFDTVASVTYRELDNLLETYL
ncbi:Imm42 family immunity protein [Paraburkholderia bannensis]|uniref:Imm42 family immunity protein n=1 Tax=Paraburkholderia bannensis TaxID=765414 RepID=UPI0038CD6DF6